MLSSKHITPDEHSPCLVPGLAFSIPPPHTVGFVSCLGRTRESPKHARSAICVPRIPVWDRYWISKQHLRTALDPGRKSACFIQLFRADKEYNSQDGFQCHVWPSVHPAKKIQCMFFQVVVLSLGAAPLFEKKGPWEARTRTLADRKTGAQGVKKTTTVLVLVGAGAVTELPELSAQHYTPLTASYSGDHKSPRKSGSSF